MNTTNFKPLPSRPDLEQYRKQAKDFIKACKSGNSETIHRISKYHPQASAGANIDAGWYLTGNELIDDVLRRHLTEL